MATNEHHSGQQLLVPWIYDLSLCIFALCLDMFFRKVHARGAGRVPKRGPVIIIATPHANQFVDSTLLMHILKHHANRSYLLSDCREIDERVLNWCNGCAHGSAKYRWYELWTMSSLLKEKSVCLIQRTTQPFITVGN